MTVQTTTSRADYGGNGVTSAFPVPFYFLDSTHLALYRTDTSTGATTQLALNTDYTVSGAGVSAGGTVTMTVAPTVTQHLAILRSVPLTQLLHYVPNDPFPAASHETALDLLTMITQQLSAQISGTSLLQFPVGDTQGLNAILPNALSRANNLLGFDASGNVVAVAPAAGSATALAAALVSSTNPAQGAGQLGFGSALTYPANSVGSALSALLGSTAATTIPFTRTAVGAVTTTIGAWMNAQIVNVKADFGAKGDGSTDDTVAIQAAADYIANFQNLQITAQKLTKAALYFPDGNYKITSQVKLRGFLSVQGTGIGYTGGSTIRQYTGAKNIFELYGSQNDHTSLGMVIQGLNFEFDASIANGSATGFAIFCPKFDDIAPGNVLASNSIYVRDCRFGGWHRQGQFVSINHGNDIEISRCVVDVTANIGGVNTPAILMGDASDAVAQVTDLRISGNLLYFCLNAIALRNVAGFTITGNGFSTQFAAGWSSLQFTSGAAGIVQGRIRGGIVQGNEFSGQYTPVFVDGSVTDVTFAGNTFVDQHDYLVTTVGASPVERIQFIGNNVQLNAGFTRVALMTSPLCKIQNSTISDLEVDCNGVTTEVGLMLETSTLSSFGDGMTLRNFSIRNNPSVLLPGQNSQLMPCTTRELVVEDQQTFVGAYPTSAPVFNMAAFGVGDSVTFDLDYEVVVNKPGTNNSVRTGRVRVSIARLANAGLLKSDVTAVSSVGDDFNGTGGGQIPTVTFTVTTGSPATVCVTATSAIATPTNVVVKCKALNFRASSAVANVGPQIKSA